MIHLLLTWFTYCQHDSPIVNMIHLLSTWSTYCQHDPPIVHMLHLLSTCFTYCQHAPPIVNTIHPLLSTTAPGSLATVSGRLWTVWAGPRRSGRRWWCRPSVCPRSCSQSPPGCRQTAGWLHAATHTQKRNNIIVMKNYNKCEREREREMFYLRLYGVRHMVKDHSDSEKGNPLPPHRLLISINSNGSFICTIPQTG